MKIKLKDYLIATFVIIPAAAICFPLSPLIGYQAVGLFFLMIVAVLSLFLRRSALIYAALLNFAVWNFFFIPPLFTFRVHSVHDVISLFANLLVAIVGSTLINRVSKSRQAIRINQERLAILYGLLESLNNAASIKEVVRNTCEELKKNFEAEAVIYLKEKVGSGLAKKAFGNIDLVNEEEYLKAKELFRHPSNVNEFDLDFTKSGAICYFPLADPRGNLGVIGILFKEDRYPDAEKVILLRSFLVQIASALDREISIDQVKDKEILEESEKLFQTVLNSVSHELRTPISIISAAVSNLNDERTYSNEEIRKEVISELNLSLHRLNLLVENILDMSRIESGHLKLNLQYCDLADLIGYVVQEMKSERHDHTIFVNFQENLPLIKADISLLKQVLINILHNAMLYTPEGSSVFINTFQISMDRVVLEIIDQGKGIPEGNLDRIFDKFYRVPGTQSGGTGLGLAIAKAIVEAHQGRIIAENIQPGGLKITISFKV
ncbi:MAG: ATP-binding protein [Bacteroidota bacterium]